MLLAFADSLKWKYKSFLESSNKTHQGYLYLKMEIRTLQPRFLTQCVNFPTHLL